jgi:hypothetical protein
LKEAPIFLTMSWKYENGQLLYEDDSVQVTLRYVKKSHDEKEGITLNVLPKDYALNPYFLYEWEKYRILVKPKKGDKIDLEKLNIYFGDDKADYDRDGNFWEYTYRNYIGKSEVKIHLGDRLLPHLQVEVISQKLSLNKEDKLFYPDFCRELIESLEKYQLTLPIEITSPTYIYAEDIPVPPNLLILYHQISEIEKVICEGIGTILMNPHKELTVAEEYVKLHQVYTVNPEVCLSIIQDPQMLVKSSLRNISLCSKLKGYLPEKVAQHIKTETYDNPENRFVKYFIRELLNYITQIEKNYSNKLGEKSRVLAELKGNLEIALQHECFHTISEFRLTPTFTSQVLLKKDGYKEILQAYNKLLLSKLPIFTYIQEKINQRNIAEMYEFWCFFELSQKLADFLGIKPENFKVKIETTLEGGLAQNKVKSVIGDYELIYNKKFIRSKKGSYSIMLKPDFSLQKNEELLVAFDSKFRFDIRDQDLEEESAEINEENAIRNLEIERIADISDIFKMHTYKDALNLKAAIILYPGNKNIFYSKFTCQKTEGSFEDIFKKICSFEEGIGCISLIPSKLQIAGKAG